MKKIFVFLLFTLAIFVISDNCFAGPKKRRKTETAENSDEQKSKKAVDELIQSFNGESGRRDFTREDFSFLEEMDLSNKRIEGYVFDGAIFPEKTDFSETTIKTCSFVGTSLIGAIW